MNIHEHIRIGSGSPAAALDVLGDAIINGVASSQPSLTVTAPNAGPYAISVLNLTWSVNPLLGMNVYQRNDGVAAIDTNQINNMSFGIDGKVGFGLYNPSEKVHVNGNILLTANNVIYFADTNRQIGSTNAWAQGGAPVGDEGLLLYNSDGANYYYVNGNANDASHWFQSVRNGQGAIRTNLQIHNSGSVQIGHVYNDGYSNTNLLDIISPDAFSVAQRFSIGFDSQIYMNIDPSSTVGGGNQHLRGTTYLYGIGGNSTIVDLNPNNSAQSFGWIWDSIGLAPGVYSLMNTNSSVRHFTFDVYSGNMGISTGNLVAPTAKLQVNSFAGAGSVSLMNLTRSDFGNIFSVSDFGNVVIDSGGYGASFNYTSTTAILNLNSNGGVVTEINFNYANGVSTSGSIYGTNGGMSISYNQYGLGVGLSYFTPAASLHIQGDGATISTKAFKVNNNTPVELFSIYDSGQISAGDGNLGLYMGVSSGVNASGALYSTAFGVNALAAIVTGNYNTALGYGSLSVLNGGDRNTGVGFAAFAQLATGFGNVGLGWAVASGAINADGITAVGFSALSANTNGNNSAFGFSASGNSTGTGLSAFGYQANEFSIKGTDNTAFGYQAHRRNYIGSFNSVFGSIAGQANYVDGSYNCYYGYETGYANGLFNFTQGGDFNNTTDPLTVDMSVYAQFSGKLSVNDYILIDGEILKVTLVVGPNITFARGQLGSTTVVHADGVNVFGGRSRNTFLGTFAGSASLSNDSVFIGYSAGQSENADNRFILANANNTLLYGDFLNKRLALGTSTIVAGDTFTIKSSTNDTSGRAFYFENSDASANFFMYNDGLINLNTTHGGVCFSIASSASSAIFNIGGTGSTGVNYKIGATLTSSVYVDPTNHIIGLLQAGVNFSISDSSNNQIFYVKESNGNVAIGSNTSPLGSTKLSIQTAAAEYGFAHTEGTVIISSYVTGSEGWFGTRSNHPFLFMTNGSEVGYIRTNGNWGIGGADNSSTASLMITGTHGYDQFNLQTTFTPANTADANGHQGDIAWDDNNIYVKTSAGWKKSALSTF